MSSSHIQSTDSALKASGTGTLSISDTLFESDRLGLSFSGISATTLDSVVVNISTGGEKESIFFKEHTHSLICTSICHSISLNPEVSEWKAGGVISMLKIFL